MLADLKDRLADLQFCVSDTTRRGRVAFEFRGLEDATVEVDRCIGVADDQVWTDSPQPDSLVLGFQTPSNASPPSTGPAQ